MCGRCGEISGVTNTSQSHRIRHGCRHEVFNLVPAISHHYLPQVYLRRFTPRDNRKLLWEFDKSTGALIESSPKNCELRGLLPRLQKKRWNPRYRFYRIDLGQIETKIDSVYEAIRMQRPLSAAEWRAFMYLPGQCLSGSPHSLTDFINSLPKYWSMVSRLPRPPLSLLSAAKN